MRDCEWWCSCHCSLPRKRWSHLAALYLLVLLVCSTVERASASNYRQPLPLRATATDIEQTRERRATLPQDDTEMSGSGTMFGSGLGSGALPLTCSRTAVVAPFSVLARRLKLLAEGCRFFGASATFTAREVGAIAPLFTVASSNDIELFADYLLPGHTRRLLVTATCNGGGCQQLEMDLNLTVSQHLSRLLPYGSLLGDSSLSDVDDATATVVAYQPIPVFDDRHTQFYVRNAKHV